MPDIISESIRYSYRKKEVLKDINFTIKGGEITYLAGLNGSGKTTWIKLAAQLMKNQEGSILFGGKQFSYERANTSIVFDTPPIYPKLSCYDNLYVLYEVDTKTEETRKLLYAMGFSNEKLKSKAQNLSLGQRHRLGIAGALLRNPKYLILDEPDLGLDPISWDCISEILLTMKGKGAAIMLTGQNFSRYEEIIDKIVILVNGSVSFNGTINDLKQKFSDETNSVETKIIVEKMIRGGV